MMKSDYRCSLTFLAFLCMLKGKSLLKFIVKIAVLPSLFNFFLNKDRVLKLFFLMFLHPKIKNSFII